MGEYTGKIVLNSVKEKPTEPGFKEKAGAFTYGAGTGFVGGPGELEEFSAYTAPEFFGADKNKQQLFGRETAFPTIKEAQQVLGAIGIQKPKEDVSGYQTAGEIIGGLGTAIPGIIRGGKSLIGSDFVRSLMGTKTKEQAAKLAEEAKTAGVSGREALEEETKGIKGKLSESQEKARLAEKVEEKETAKGSRTLSNLLGVRTELEAGSFRPIPQTPAQVGGYIRDQAQKFVNSIKNRRSELTSTNFASALDEAKKLESSNKFIQQTEKFGDVIKYLDNRLSVVTDPSIRTQLETIKTALTKGAPIRLTEGERRVIALRENTTLDKVPEQTFLKPTFEGVEIMRRRIGDAAFNVPEEGYKAIGQSMAKDIYSKLSDSMKDYSKGFSKYLDDYKRLSEPIEVYGTKIGKGLTETIDTGGKYYAKTAESIAKDIFSSPEKYKQFVDAVGGNKQIAEAAAQRYFAGILETAKTPEAVETVFRNNRALFGSEGALKSVAKDLERRYLFPLKESVTRVSAAKEIALKAKEFDKTLAARLENVKGSESLLSDSIEALASAKPKDAINVFNKTVLPKLRAAEEKAGITLLSPSQVSQFRERVRELEKVADEQTRNRLIGTIVGGYLIGSGVYSKATQLMGE